MVEETTAGGNNAAPDLEEEKRERSRIVFPYNDLKEATTVASAIWDHVGAGTCEIRQLAAWLKHDSISSGAFRMKVNAARIFGLIKTEPNRISLTQLGKQIVDAGQAEQAKVDAFLHVPLYKAVYGKYSDGLLPNNVGLEREMADLGVAEKQTDKARQAFQRSAKDAGFFEEGNNKLVRPAVALREGESKPQVETGGGGGGTPPMHPFIKGLVETLPPAGSDWPGDKQDEWIAAAKAIFRIIYTGSSEQNRTKSAGPTEQQPLS